MAKTNVIIPIDTTQNETDPKNGTDILVKDSDAIKAGTPLEDNVADTKLKNGSGIETIENPKASKNGTEVPVAESGMLKNGEDISFNTALFTDKTKVFIPL